MDINMINTIHGMMDENKLTICQGGLENEHEKTTWTEYKDGGEVVRRDVHVTLKKGAIITPDITNFK